MQKKTILFLNGATFVGIWTIPAFATLADETIYHQNLWKEEAFLKLVNASDYNMEYIHYSPLDKQKEMDWILNETAKISDELLFSETHKKIMPLVMQGKLVKEIADFFERDESTIKTHLMEMRKRAAIENGDINDLKEYFIKKINIHFLPLLNFKLKGG